MRYFVQHPHAADSLEGIARWRLQQQRVLDLVAETSDAVEQLVEEGLLERVTLPGGGTLYRLRPEQEGTARRLAE